LTGKEGGKNGGKEEGMAKVYGGMRAGHEHKFCFSATFLSELLRTGLGVEEDAPIPMLGDMSGVEIDWALGLVLSRAQMPRAAALGPANASTLKIYTYKCTHI
jgi:hypothetical protein